MSIKIKLYLSLLLLISCGEPHDDNNKEVEENPSSEILFSTRMSNQMTMQNKLDQIDPRKDILEERPSWMSPRNFLKELNPNLVPFLGNTISLGTYQFIPLLKMSEDQRADFLNSLIYSKDLRGYAVITKKFWTQTFEFQDQGYTIGFIENKPKNRIAGIYYDKYKYIGIDMIAGEVTLEHEYRHAVQYDSIRPSMTGKINGLSNECYSKLHSFFAETDANTHEIKFWDGAFDRMIYEAPWYATDRDRVLKIGEPIHYPYGSDFAVSVTYPYNKAGEITLTNICPENIKQFVSKVHERLGAYYDEIIVSSATISNIRQSIFNSWKTHYEKCDENGNNISTVFRDEDCKVSLEDVHNWINFKKNNVKDLNPIFMNEAKVRPNDLKNLYKDAPLKSEFCKEMPGFKFYADCNS